MFESEIWYRTSRSSGKGGQNVNKVSTKVELNFDVAGSKLLTDTEKLILFQKLENRINKEGILKVVAESSRSQLENKSIALDKFKKLISDALRPQKKRLPTKKTRASKEARLHQKKRHSEIKASRRKPEW